MSEKKWAYLDPAAPRRNKLVSVGGEAAWYWACGLCYCRDSDREEERPGFIPRNRALKLYEAAKRPQKLIDKLVDIGLWLLVDGGYIVAGYGEIYGSATTDPTTALVEELTAAAPKSSVSAARAAAGRAGGLRSVESRRASKQTAQPSKQTAEANPRFASVPSKQNPKQNSGSSSPVGSLSSLEIREIPKENPHPKDLSGESARGVCFEEEDEFSKLDLRERADRITADPALAAEAKPHRWPEVVAVVRAFVCATGIERPCVAYDRDRGVRAAVALLAGWDVETICGAIPIAVKTDWWRSRPRDMGYLSPAVIEDALVRLGEAERREARKRRVQVATGEARRAGPEPAGISLSEYMSEVSSA